jgi:hypothetical protein
MAELPVATGVSVPTMRLTPSQRVVVKALKFVVVDQDVYVLVEVGASLSRVAYMCS